MMKVVKKLFAPLLCLYLLPTLMLEGCNEAGKAKAHTVREYDSKKNLTKEFNVDATGLKQGLYKEYYPNGNLKSVYRYLDGKPSGEQRQYYENGILQATGYYVNGQLDSLQRWYHPNGHLKSESFRLNSKLFGVQRVYGKDGNLEELYFMANDTDMVSSVKLDSSGKIVSQKGELVYCIYNQKELKLTDTMKALFYTLIPPSYTSNCKLLERVNGTMSKEQTRQLELINNNYATIYTGVPKDRGENIVTFVIELTYKKSKQQFVDSLAMKFSVN